MEFLPSFEKNIPFYIFCILSAMLFIQLLYVFFIYMRFAFFRERKKSILEENNFPPVSVVIAARNESDNLYQYLPLILNQDYPNFKLWLLIINQLTILTMF